MTPPLCLVIEDHPEVAQNNCLFLQKVEPEAICIVAETPEQGLERLQLETPELIVVDLQFGTLSGQQSGKPGLDFLRQIFQSYSTLNILVYTSDPSLLRQLVSAINEHEGGFVVVNKMERRSAFMEGVRNALDGELRLPRELWKELQQTLSFNERELKVLGLLCKKALTDREIAAQLHIHLRTAQNYVQRLKDKLGVNEDTQTNSRIALCMEAIRRRIILP